MPATFFELPDGKLVCFNPGGRFHGWMFRRYPDGRLVSSKQLMVVYPPVSDLSELFKDKPNDELGTGTG